jgi:hypothetical protein
MGLYDFALVVAFGMVASGLSYSLWPLVSGREATMSMFLQSDGWAPLRALVMVVCAPAMLARAGVIGLAGHSSALYWLLAFATSLALCFIQGVVVVVALGLSG